MILVVDASVLITLARIGRLQLLHELSEEIVVPHAVYAEENRKLSFWREN